MNQNRLNQRVFYLVHKGNQLSVVVNAQPVEDKVGMIRTKNTTIVRNERM